MPSLRQYRFLKHIGMGMAMGACIYPLTIDVFDGWVGLTAYVAVLLGTATTYQLSKQFLERSPQP